jgi:hypothetical protein
MQFGIFCLPENEVRDAYKILIGTSEGREKYEDLGVDGKIILS